MGEPAQHSGQPVQKPVVGRLLQFAGVICGLAVLGLGMWLAEDVLQSMRRSIGLGSIGLAFAVGAFFWNWGKQHLAPMGEEAIARDPRPPILYLRSFVEEAAIGADEKALADILGEAGPFVAIGRPGDPLPPLGASRFYVPDADWQKFVIRLMDEAALVVMMAGQTQGLGWEIRQCKKYMDPNCVLVLVPDDKNLYDAFRAQVETGTKIKLPEFIQGRGPEAGRILGLIQFNGNWQGEWERFEKARFRGSNPMRADRNTRRRPRLRQALSKACQDAGLSIEPAGLNLPHLLALLVASAGLITVLVLIVLASTGQIS